MPLLILAGARNLEVFSPDGVAYMRVAQYYLAGQADLAINGYWGPLISWMMVPFLPLSDDPVVAARFATGISAVLFLLGALRVSIVLGLTVPAFVAGAVILVPYSVYWSVRGITPDLLFSGLFLLGLSFILEVGRGGIERRALVAGVVVGTAYLAKAVALPVSITVVIALAMLRGSCGMMAWRHASRAAVLSLTGIGLIAAPWIVVLSMHYGKPTFSTSGAINHAIAGPDAGPHQWAHPFTRTFHVPAPGRITSWEDPSQMNYPQWSAFESLENFVHQVRVSIGSIGRISSILTNFDLFGLGLAAAAMGFFFHWPWKEGFEKQPWRQVGLIVAIHCSAYILFSTRVERYFVNCYPLLMVAAFGFTHWLADQVNGHGRWGILGEPGRLFPMAAVALVLFAFVPRSADLFAYGLSGQVDQAYLHAKSVAAALGPMAKDPSGGVAVAGPDNDFGIRLSFVSGRPYFGRSNVAVDAATLHATGAKILVVARGSATDVALAADPSVAPLGLASARLNATSEDLAVRVYRVLTPGR